MEKETNYKYIVYCTINQINNKIYVGVHKTLTPNKFDKYLGNGIIISLPYTYKYAKTAFLRAVNKYGVKNFKRYTLATFDTEDEAYDLEEKIVNDTFLSRSDVYNLVPGGKGGILKVYTIKVFKYNEKGKYIAEYNSIVEAAKKHSVTHGSIWHAIHKKLKACGAFWSTDKLEYLDLTLYNLGENHRKEVHLYDISGNYIKSFNSLYSCAKEINCPVSNISNSAILGYCIIGKYYCSYILSDNYSKAKTEYIKQREVHQYDSTGKYIKTYSTQQEAEEVNKGSNISKAIKGKTVDKNGYMWGLVKLDYFNIPELKVNSKRKVGKYTLQGTLIQEYDSATSAASNNGVSIWKVLNGTNKTHKGCIYKYID